MKTTNPHIREAQQFPSTRTLKNVTLTSLIIKLITSDETTWTAARERRRITYRGTKTRMAATSHEDQHRMKSVEECLSRTARNAGKLQKHRWRGNLTRRRQNQGICRCEKLTTPSPAGLHCYTRSSTDRRRRAASCEWGSMKQKRHRKQQHTCNIWGLTNKFTNSS